MKSCLVCFSLPFESAPFRKILRCDKSGNEISVLDAGVGRSAFVAALDRAIAVRKPDSVVFAGFCAGIHPSAVVGSVFHARTPEIHPSIATASGKNQTTGMPCINGCLTTAKTVRGERIGGSLISVHNVLATAGDKADLSRNFPSLLVADMETMHGLAAARAQGIAASVLRVVSDGLRDNLPVPPHILFDENRQRTPLAGLCVHLIANPASFPSFTRFVRNVHWARKILAQTLIASLQNGSLFGPKEMASDSPN